MENGRDFFRERQLHGRAPEQYDDDLLAFFDKPFDERELIFGKAHILPVAALTLHIIGEPRKDEHFLELFCPFKRLAKERVVR